MVLTICDVCSLVKACFCSVGVVNSVSCITLCRFMAHNYICCLYQVSKRKLKSHNFHLGGLGSDEV